MPLAAYEATPWLHPHPNTLTSWLEPEASGRRPCSLGPLSRVRMLKTSTAPWSALKRRRTAGPGTEIGAGCVGRRALGTGLSHCRRGGAHSGTRGETASCQRGDHPTHTARLAISTQSSACGSMTAIECGAPSGPFLCFGPLTQTMAARCRGRPLQYWRPDPLPGRDDRAQRAIGADVACLLPLRILMHVLRTGQLRRGQAAVRHGL